MDGATLSRFPHLSWMKSTYTVDPAAGPVCWHWRGTAHILDLFVRGRGSCRWLTHGQETEVAYRSGLINFVPADGGSHTCIGQAIEETTVFTVVMPRHHLDSIAEEDHVSARTEYRRLLSFDDAIVRSCMVRLSQSAGAPDQWRGFAKDEAARRLVLRLVELSGGGRPDWHDDASVFDRRTLESLVEHIDAHLNIAPSVRDMGMRVGLSPGHFAKKFRQSTGLSLHRFVNRRRLRASLVSLRDQSQPIAHVALELGFSSQAHFTHLFSMLTGMTPAKYRKQFRPIVG